MVTGFESFKRWFSEYSEQYTIIGGTACDLLMSEEGMDFRATRDIDMVLIVEPDAAVRRTILVIYQRRRVRTQE